MDIYTILNQVERLEYLTGYSLGELVDLFEDGCLIVNPDIKNLQRWCEVNKEELKGN